MRRGTIAAPPFMPPMGMRFPGGLPIMPPLPGGMPTMPPVPQQQPQPPAQQPQSGFDLNAYQQQLAAQQLLAAQAMQQQQQQAFAALHPTLLAPTPVPEQAEVHEPAPPAPQFVPQPESAPPPSARPVVARGAGTYSTKGRASQYSTR